MAKKVKIEPYSFQSQWFSTQNPNKKSSKVVILDKFIKVDAARKEILRIIANNIVIVQY